MTPRQELNALLVFGPLALVFVAELTLLLARPAWLARFAYLPVGRPRRVILQPRVRAVLSRPGDYRRASAGTIDLAPLARPLPTNGDGALRIDAHGVATFRLPLGRMFALGGACGVRIVAADDAIALRARMLPPLAPTCAALFLPLIGLALTGGDPAGRAVVAPVLATLFVVFQAAGALRSRHDFGRQVDAMLDTIERRIEAVADERT